MLLSLELANLKRVMDRGEPFTAELAAVKKAAGDKLDLDSRWSATCSEGVPTTAELAKSFRKVANAMLDAEAEPADAIARRPPAVGRPLDRARAQGRPQPPTTPALDAIIGRMDVALKDGPPRRGAGAGPRSCRPRPRSSAEDWLSRSRPATPSTRRIADVEDRLKSSLGAARAPALPEPSDDAPRRSSCSSFSASPPACTGWPTGPAPSSSSGRATSPRPACFAPSSSWPR